MKALIRLCRLCKLIRIFAVHICSKTCFCMALPISTEACLKHSMTAFNCLPILYLSVDYIFWSFGTIVSISFVKKKLDFLNSRLEDIAELHYPKQHINRLSLLFSCLWYVLCFQIIFTLIVLKNKWLSSKGHGHSVQPFSGTKRRRRNNQ